MSSAAVMIAGLRVQLIFIQTFYDNISLMFISGVFIKSYENLLFSVRK